ncbi:MAG: CBS domain-containing protein [Candidatus Dormibacteria bacterium]
MQIGPLVSRALLELAPTDSIAEAARQMTARKVGSAVVMTDGGASIITERDVLRAVANGADLATARVEDFMTHNAITAFEDWGLQEAAECMSAGGFRHLIVLGAGGQVEGILSIRDLLRALLKEAGQAASR